MGIVSGGTAIESEVDTHKRPGIKYPTKPQKMNTRNGVTRLCFSLTLLLLAG